MFDEEFERTWPPRLFPMNELAIDFPSSRVDDGYLEVLIVAQALVTEQCAIASRLPLKSIPILSLNGTPSFISKKNFRIAKPQIDSAWKIMNATRLSERACRDSALWPE